MGLVDERYKDRWGQYKQEEMSKEEVGRPERQLDNLDDEFTGRLGHDVSTEPTTVPFPSPPGAVGLIVLELSGEEH
jgi:hypothetical protein